MKRKNNGKDVLLDHSEAASIIFPVRIMVVDSDEKSLQENVTILQKFPDKYKVTKCDKTDQAFTWLETDGSEFDIILVGECLPAANKSKLLLVGNARDLPVLVTSADDGIDTITRSIDDGACAYLPKPIPESVLGLVWIHVHVHSKRKNKLAQSQKLANDASGEKKPRLIWTDDLTKKFEESLNELGGVVDAKPTAILKRMKTKGIQDIPITTANISSFRQKYRKRLEKDEKRTIEGSTLKTESNELPRLDRGIILEDSSLPSNKSFPAGMFENYTGDDDIAHGHSNSLLDGHVLTMMTVSGTIPLHTPGYKDKEGTSSEHVESRNEMMEHPLMILPHLNTTNPNQQGFNLPRPVEANTSCTIGGQTFINCLPDNLFDGSPIIDTGDIFQDPSLSWSNESCPVGIFENYTGNDIAHEHSNNLFVDDYNFLVDHNYLVGDDALTLLTASWVIPRVMLLCLDVYVLGLRSRVLHRECNSFNINHGLNSVLKKLTHHIFMLAIHVLQFLSYLLFLLQLSQI